MKSDIIASVIYLKNKVHKWRNISALLFFFSLALVFKFTFFSSNLEVESITSYIAKIEINDVIFEDDHRSQVLRKLASQDSTKAVLVKISSPGGGIVGSEILYRDLLAISQKKPLVVLMGSVAASGAYMAALASDHILAHNGTLTGSIGVLMQLPNASELAKKIGISNRSFKSSPIKGYPSLTEESNSEYDKIIQSSINDSYNFFADLVKKRRSTKLKHEYMSEIFDGRIFTGRQALEVGLIDGIGLEDDALQYLITQNPKLKDLPLREISIVKKEDKFTDRLIGKLPFLKSLLTESSIYRDYDIMAIMR